MSEPIDKDVPIRIKIEVDGLKFTAISFANPSDAEYAKFAGRGVEETIKAVGRGEYAEPEETDTDD